VTLTEQAAYAVTAAGVLAGAAGAISGRWREALPLSLDLWTAAGLLRLTADRSWSAVATAAALVLVRRVVARPLLRPDAASGHSSG
jgi:hypothetical protein